MRNRHYLYLIFGFFLVLTGCSGKEDLRPKRDCPIEQLLLDQSAYPSGTILNEIISPVADKPLESADQSADYQDSGLFQIVIRYFSTENATAEYDDRKKSIFAPDEVVGVWETPPILDLNNLSADRHQIACGNVISFGRRCYLISQYEEYYVFFRADISKNGITHELFRDLARKIDDEIDSCVNRE